jgi:hypothetical protein
MTMRRVDRHCLRITRPTAGDRLLIWSRPPAPAPGGSHAQWRHRLPGGCGLEPAGCAVYGRHHLAAVGFREVQPLDAKGQAFTISLILAGVLALFVALASVTELVVSGQPARVLRRRRRDARIGRLDQHTGICAYGRAGRAVAEELTRQDLPFVVVEP